MKKHFAFASFIAFVLALVAACSSSSPAPPLEQTNHPVFAAAKPVLYAPADLTSASNVTLPGSSTDVLFNNSGALGGSSGLTWNGSTLTATNLTVSTLLTAPGFGKTVSLLADFTSTTSTSAQSTNLTISAAASTAFMCEGEEVWSLASGTTGAKMAIAAPTSSTIEGQINCATSAATAFTSSIITATSTLGVACNTVSATTLPLQWSARVKTSVTSGAIAFQVAPVGAIVLTVKAGSWMRCTQVTEL